MLSLFSQKEMARYPKAFAALSLAWARACFAGLSCCALAYWLACFLCDASGTGLTAAAVVASLVLERGLANDF